MWRVLSLSLPKFFNSRGYAALFTHAIHNFRLYLVYDTPKDKAEALREVEVLEANIIDATKGYIRVKVSKDFLNADFNIPVTLKYRSGRYEPVTLTFMNDSVNGAGVIITSPEREKTTAIYLNEQIRYIGFGPQAYAEDFIFKFYYNDSHVFLRTESGEIGFLSVPPGRYVPPPIRYGGNLLAGYFDDEGHNRETFIPSEVEELERYFETYRPK